jgi:5-methylcytosine-specific restriction endonuclease McrA
VNVAGLSGTPREKIMPRRPPRFCPSCRNIVPAGRPCVTCKRAVDRTRGSSTARGYDRQWRRRRASYLAEHPLCVACGNRATVVDHRVSLSKGGADAPSNYQSLCASCHGRKTVSVDHRFG